MKLSISNIAWKTELDTTVYKLMQDNGFSGLEIAPTRIFVNEPYNHIENAKKWADNLKNLYGISVSSMQSIWFGRTEKLFNSVEERNFLLNYTKRTIDFAKAIGCGNIVFGCPKNRCITKEDDLAIGVSFFKELGDYALEKDTVIGMEANPSIYNTNYINTTRSALELIKEVNSLGFKLNLDIGTMIANNESSTELLGNVKYINHVHISEPWLKPIEQRGLHKDIINILINENYSRYISIEMGNVESVDSIELVIKYIKTL